MIDIILATTTVISFGCIAYMVSRKMPLLLAVPENLISESFVIRPSKAKVVWDHIAEWFLEKHYIIWGLFFLEGLFRAFHMIFGSIDWIFYSLYKKAGTKKAQYLSHSESGYWKYPAHWRRASEKKSEVAENISEELPFVDSIAPR